MNPVKKFLEENDGYTFEEGVAVLRRYGNNPGVLSFVERRHDKDTLDYELRRLSCFMRMPWVSDLPTDKPVKVAVANAPKENRASRPVGRAAVTFKDLNHRSNTRLEDMPTELTRDLWCKNRDEYKELAAWHEKMKAANSDAGRSECRGCVLSLEESIAERWRIIDSEIERIRKQQEGLRESAEINVGNCRSYIAKALKAKKITEAKLVELQRRVDALLAAGETFNPETVERLKSAGISC